MATTTSPTPSAPLRSAAPLPLRPAPETHSAFDTLTGRIPMRAFTPWIPGGPYRPKAYQGEAVPFGVTAFREGHDRIGVHLRLTSPSGEESLHALEQTNRGLDLWRVLVALGEEGVWSFRFEAFGDDFLTWEHNADIKIAAGIDVPLMRETGALLFDRAVAEPDRPDDERRALENAAAALRDEHVNDEAALSIVRDPALADFFAARPLMSISAVSPSLEILVERRRAGVGSWYEFFPRSEGAKRKKDGTVVPGTLKTAQRRMPAVRAMGFDVLYIPPVQPIGTTNRKGRNNTLVAQPGDPGSPYGTGSEAGGHDAVNPELGTMEDFAGFVKAAAENGLEVALDFALQASPDHPWVAEHPEWFVTLPDGSIAFAENPPKKYQDIYPIYFDADPEGLYAEILRVARVWIEQGVRIFRVDNPHTKPLEFWEWLIATINADHPDIIWLAEAFSRPAVMQTLAKAGFQQSYSYYTWRNTKAELQEFLTSVSQETADFMRPNLFVNTHDILTEYLQFGGRPGYKVRAAIAATAAPTWGVYAGYELFENVARPGSEENIDNEKYEIKVRDWEGAEAAGDSLAPYLTRLNHIRDAHPALGQLRNIRFHWADDDAVLVYSKHLDAALSPTGEDDTIIVVANVDPHSVRQTMIHLDTTVWGVAPGEAFEVEDLITGEVWTWSDHDFVRLDAFYEPVHILHVKETSR